MEQLDYRMRVYADYSECIGRIIDSLHGDDRCIRRWELDHIIWYGLKGRQKYQYKVTTKRLRFGYASKKASIYSDDYIDYILAKYQDLFASREQVIDLIYGISGDESRFLTEPLSKFKTDIYNQIMSGY